MPALVRIYRALFVAQLQAAAQYRVQSILWLLLSVVRPVIFLAAWTSVANGQGGQVGGFSAADFAAYYVSVTLVLQLTQAWNAWEFEFEVRNGQLSPKLLRPLHPIHYAVVENLVWKMITLVALIPVLLLISWTFDARFGMTQPWQVLLFVPSVLVAATLRFVFWWVLALGAFWTTRIQSVVSLVDRVSFVFAGQIAPLGLLPGPLQGIAYVLPFGYMLGVPADLLRGGPTLEQALLMLAGQIAWLGLCLLALALVWRVGVRQYSAVGA